MQARTTATRTVSWPLKVVGLGASLALCLVPVRAVVIGFTWDSLRTPLVEVPKMVIGACYDVAYAAGLTVLFLGLVVLCRRVPRAQRLLFGAFVILAVGSQLAALANIEVVRMLGRPFNYSWLYYSGFLASTDARQAIAAVWSWQVAMLAGCGCLGLLFLAWLSSRFLTIMRRYLTPRELGLFVIPCLVGYLAFSHWYLTTQEWNRSKLANPVATFAYSLIMAADKPALFDMATTVGNEDFQTAGERGEPRRAAHRETGDGGVRNVVLFVLESTGAAYVDPYGGGYGVTPELTRYRNRAALFRNVYAHAPGTNQSLVSLLSSVYPLISYTSLTWEHPDAPLPSLSSELKQAGYDTSFFGSADLGFQGADKFLAHRGFDVVQDYHDRTCPTDPFKSEWWYLDGSEDNCTVGSLLQWIDARRERPFFATVWTMQGHYPYFVAGAEVDYGVASKEFNRYLNALREGDEALGLLLRGLEQRHLLDSTLVVVVGDHGEAFGQHGQYSHGTALYEENVRVPLVLINPRLFHGEEYSQVGGMVDVAPTILRLLNRPLPAKWQGDGLLDGNERERVYFSAPWSDFLFGYRSGNRKLILNATQGVFEVYDLAADPGESRNLAASSGDFILSAEQHLAAWVQYQSRFYDALFAAGDSTSGASVPPLARAQ